MASLSVLLRTYGFEPHRCTIKMVITLARKGNPPSFSFHSVSVTTEPPHLVIFCLYSCLVRRPRVGSIKIPFFPHASNLPHPTPQPRQSIARHNDDSFDRA